MLLTVELFARLCCRFNDRFVNTAYAASYDAEDVQVSQDQSVTLRAPWATARSGNKDGPADDGVAPRFPISCENNGKDYTGFAVSKVSPYGTKGNVLNN